eukprot:6674848-Prymnesium_polylepis.1
MCRADREHGASVAARVAGGGHAPHTAQDRVAHACSPWSWVAREPALSWRWRSPHCDRGREPRAGIAIPIGA